MSTTLEKLRSGQLPTDFNWNRDNVQGFSFPQGIPMEPTPCQADRTILVAEDLRDGLHGVGETYPPAEKMLEYVGALDRFGIDKMTIGIYPGGGTKIDKTIRELAAKMREQYAHVTPIVLSFANQASLDWVGDLKQINPKLTPLVFMGSAPFRLLVEEWDKEYLLHNLSWAIAEAKVRHQVDVIGATEHTTQTPPDFLKDIIRAQVNAGIDVFCIADTIGVARPIGAYRVVDYVRKTLDEVGGENVLIDWHGHDDLGNGIANAMVAIAAGANRVHTVARGIGERAGNTRFEGVVANLSAILDENNISPKWNLSCMDEVLRTYDNVIGRPSPNHGPFGQRAFSTSLGIHTAAILKAENLAQEAYLLGDSLLGNKLSDMSRTIYSAIDPEKYGRKHEVHVGPWSGGSSVKVAYILMGGELKNLTQERINMVLTAAKSLNREFTPNELQQLLFNGNSTSH